MLRTFIIAGALLAAGVPAAAQSTDDMVETIASLARDNLGHSAPIVPAALDQQTVRRGALTAQVQACGGPWEKASYLPYMAGLRASRRYSEKQLAYVGVVHGIAQQLVFRSLASRAERCPPHVCAAVTQALAR